MQFILQQRVHTRTSALLEAGRTIESFRNPEFSGFPIKLSAGSNRLRCSTTSNVNNSDTAAAADGGAPATEGLRCSCCPAAAAAAAAFFFNFYALVHTYLRRRVTREPVVP